MLHEIKVLEINTTANSVEKDFQIQRKLTQKRG